MTLCHVRDNVTVTFTHTAPNQNQNQDQRITATKRNFQILAERKVLMFETIRTEQLKGFDWMVVMKLIHDLHHVFPL